MLYISRVCIIDQCLKYRFYTLFWYPLIYHLVSRVGSVAILRCSITELIFPVHLLQHTYLERRPSDSRSINLQFDVCFALSTLLRIAHQTQHPEMLETIMVLNHLKGAFSRRVLIPRNTTLRARQWIEVQNIVAVLVLLAGKISEMGEWYTGLMHTLWSNHVFGICARDALALGGIAHHGIRKVRRGGICSWMI